jgi:hypothetical protein
MATGLRRARIWTSELGRFTLHGGELPEGNEMTEAEWLACADPENMVEFVTRQPELKFVTDRDRKDRLFACACCRQSADLIVDARCLEAVQVAERYADGLADADDIVTAFQVTYEIAEELRSIQEHGGAAASAAYLTNVACEESGEIPYWAYQYLLELTQEDIRPVRQAWCKYVIRCIWGPLPFRLVSIAPAWLTPNVVGIARTIYEERAFHLLPILSDALEEAGCDNADILSHLREPGPHVRGCWVVDAIIGKE